MKKIGVIGKVNIDFILYLSSVLKNLKKSVAVRNLKKTNELQSYLKEDVRDLQEYTYNDIEFYFSKEDNVAEDILINNYDISEITVLPEDLINIDFKSAVTENDFLIILCEQRKTVIDYLNKLLLEEKLEYIDKVIFIDKDFIDCKTIPSKNISKIANEENNDKIVTYQIPFDEKNYENKINLQYENKILFKISKEYTNVLKNIIKYILQNEVTEKEIKVAMQKLKKGQ